jgi:hypothetical protein
MRVCCASACDRLPRAAKGDLHDYVEMRFKSNPAGFQYGQVRASDADGVL